MSEQNAHQTLYTKPAGPDEWMDVQRALTGGGDGRSCQCCWPVMSSAEWRESSRDERREFLHTQIAAGPAPGIVCYANGDAVGWARVGPRPAQRRITASRVVRKGSHEPLDDVSVWALTCFSVRRQARGIGVMSALLQAAVEHARSGGARILEAYPFDNRCNDEHADNGETPLTANELFVGTVTTFLRAGFHVVGHPTRMRVVVSLKLD